jgi:hypothetical protein
MMPDFDLIATEYAPGYSSEDVWAVDAEMRSDGAVLIIGFGDEAPLEIPFSELGIEAEDMEAIFEEEGGEEPAISQFLWWSADGETWEPITPQGLPEFWLLPFMMGSVGTDDGFYLFAAGPDPNDPEGSFKGPPRTGCGVSTLATGCSLPQAKTRPVGRCGRRPTPKSGSVLPDPRRCSTSGMKAITPSKRSTSAGQASWPSATSTARRRCIRSCRWSPWWPRTDMQ